MQRVGSSVSAAGQGEKAGPQASSSIDCSSVTVGTSAFTEYKATRRNATKKTCNVHKHDDDNKPNQFCYVCGIYIPSHMRRNITESIYAAYKFCFKSDLINQDTNWVPHVMCVTCYNMLLTCYKKKKLESLKYFSPVVWSMPESKKDCFFCLTITQGFNVKNKSNIKYIYTRKVIPAVLVSKNYDKADNTAVDIGNEKDVGIRSSIKREEIIESDSTIESDDQSESAEEYDKRSKLPELFSQEELNDFGRELGLSKEAHELLASRLKQKNLLMKGTQITVYRNREQEMRPFFTCDKQHDLVYCNDIPKLINSLKDGVYKPDEWRLFIDSSIRSLKVILLHNTNVLAPIPIAHSTVLKESYENVKIVLERISYVEHQWKICGDLKIIGIILGMQSGNIKFPCFLCLFDSRDRVNHYKTKEWPKRKSLQAGSSNVIKPPLVNESKILIPPLHLKLGLMKQFVKALDKNGDCFKYIAQKMPKLSDAKLEAGVFDGPQIRTLINDVNFTAQMRNTEKDAWISFKNVCQNFLGNHKSQDYEKLVSDMIKNYQTLGCNMSIKLHFLDSHLNFFPDKLGDFSEEQGERCHQDMKEMEKRYQGTWGINMMADYCWNLKRDTKNNSNKRKRRSIRRSFESKQVRYHKRSKEYG